MESSGELDGGTSARMFGTLLTWLNDHTSDVFFVGTCNAVEKLPTEFTRAERFDGMFFFDLPSSEERAQIWALYFNMYDIACKESLVLTELIESSEGWTGAEIKTCCRLSAMLGISPLEAMVNVSPVSRTNPEGLDRLRGWAHDRCLSASYPGLFKKDRLESPTRPKEHRVLKPRKPQ